MIQPTIRFGQLTAERSTAFKVADETVPEPDMSGSNVLNATFCNTTITPKCLRDLYNVGDFKGSRHNGMNGNLDDIGRLGLIFSQETSLASVAT